MRMVPGGHANFRVASHTRLGPLLASVEPDLGYPLLRKLSALLPDDEDEDVIGSDDL